MILPLMNPAHGGSAALQAAWGPIHQRRPLHRPPPEACAESPPQAFVGFAGDGSTPHDPPVRQRFKYNRGAMPKLYEYLGIVVLFYSNEHEPVHVHGKYQGGETRAEMVIRDGHVVDTRRIK